MKKFVCGFIASLAATCACFGAQSGGSADIVRWEREAQNVQIIRDDWGIAHVYGKTDADAVFGMIYAQAEDDFNRVETNYLKSMGRMAEAEGESKIYQDLRMKLFIDPVEMKKDYVLSPGWLKNLMNAFADGLNFYLYKHPDVKPLVITHFEPWMALTFTEGSIGGDIERVDVAKLQAFYGKDTAAAVSINTTNAAQGGWLEEPRGSNGIAIAPSNTSGHHALLLINPHTSFFFRSELQMTSEAGLDSYGAVTWGQFFVYQGFNDRAGWMHTSSAVNNINEYLETVEKRGDRYVAKYGNEWRPVVATEITVPYKTDHGMVGKKFTVYRTGHGPIVREANGKWVSVRLMQEPIKALTQSYTRTKAKDYKSFKQIMELHTNSSNNTIFADADGDIAYFHANFIPKRDTKFDWTKPVDGSDPATDWHELLSVDDTPHLLNPKVGWLYNSNNWPWSAAGADSPKQADYPPYVDNGLESARGLHAIRVLENKRDFTISSLIAAAYDSYLPWFEKPLPILFKAWEKCADKLLKAKTAEQIALLRKWDLRWGVDSVPTSVAVFWGEALLYHIGDEMKKYGIYQGDYIATKVPPQLLLQSLAEGVDRLNGDFGSWKTPWGNINRFQRLTGDIVQPFDDAGPSIPVEFTSAQWGSLASFGAHAYPGTKKWYGTEGNSFVAVVEFADKVHARAVTAGGESGHPSSPHFNDQAPRYSTGDLREVYFYRDQLQGHTQREYHPGS
jgi:acyl-homoserine lactone acylase PvdQ